MIHSFGGTQADPAIFVTKLLDDFYIEAKLQQLVPSYCTVYTLVPGAERIWLSSNYSKVDTHGSRILVAVDKYERITGTLLFHWKDDAAYVERLTTRKGTHGYGKMLINAIKGIVEEGQHIGIRLCSTASAAGFYDKQCFFQMSADETLQHVYSPWCHPERWHGSDGGPRGWLNTMQY
jgi:hypothetical protein